MKIDADPTGKYVHALETLSAETLGDLQALCAHDIEFKDPFNHTHTCNDFRRVLEHMLAQVSNLRFDVQGHWQDGHSTVLKWRFSGQARLIGRLDIPGLSEVLFNDEGLVSHHIDYWDANEHIISRLPVVGPVVKLLTRPLSI